MQVSGKRGNPILMMTMLKILIVSIVVVTAVLVLIHLNCLGYLDRQ